jgi:D-glycero-D-manno-heptose 1,7-bisphosphate phosphatase
MFKAAFLDRDGVINRKMPEGQYVKRWEEMLFLPAVTEAIFFLQRAGFRVIVVSNRRCVAKGLLTVQELDSIHRRMCENFPQQERRSTPCITVLTTTNQLALTANPRRA